MFNKKENPVRLERVPTAGSIMEKDIVIRISTCTAIIIGLVIFVGLLFLLTQPTYGFLWY